MFVYAKFEYLMKIYVRRHRRRCRNSSPPFALCRVCSGIHLQFCNLHVHHQLFIYYHVAGDVVWRVEYKGSRIAYANFSFHNKIYFPFISFRFRVFDVCVCVACVGFPLHHTSMVNPLRKQQLKISAQLLSCARQLNWELSWATVSLRSPLPLPLLAVKCTKFTQKLNYRRTSIATLNARENIIFWYFARECLCIQLFGLQIILHTSSRGENV